MRAGTELFAARGFDGVTTDDIAAKAGVNKALISYHFRGKRGLYDAILSSTLSVAAERLRALAESPRPPQELLLDFIAAFHQMAAVERPCFPALVLREVQTRSRTFSETVVPHILGLFGSIRTIIERGVREGVFRPVNPLAAHLGIIGSLLFFYATEPVRQRLVAQKQLPLTPPSLEEFMQHMQQMVLHGLALDAPHANAEDKGESR